MSRTAIKEQGRTEVTLVVDGVTAYELKQEKDAIEKAVLDLTGACERDRVFVTDTVPAVRAEVPLPAMGKDKAAVKEWTGSVHLAESILQNVKAKLSGEKCRFLTCKAEVNAFYLLSPAEDANVSVVVTNIDIETYTNFKVLPAIAEAIEDDILLLTGKAVTLPLGETYPAVRTDVALVRVAVKPPKVSEQADADWKKIKASLEAAGKKMEPVSWQIGADANASLLPRKALLFRQSPYSILSHENLLSYTSIFGETIQPSPFFHMLGEACFMATIMNQAYTYRRYGMENEMANAQMLEDEYNKSKEDGAEEMRWLTGFSNVKGWEQHGAYFRWTLCLIETRRLCRIVAFRVILTGLFHFILPLSCRITIVAIHWNNHFLLSFQNADLNDDGELTPSEYEKSKVGADWESDQLSDLGGLVLTSLFTLLPLTWDSVQLWLKFVPQPWGKENPKSKGLLRLLCERSDWKLTPLDGVRGLNVKTFYAWFTVLTVILLFYLVIFYQTICKLIALTDCPDYMWNFQPPWTFSAGCANVTDIIQNTSSTMRSL